MSAFALTAGAAHAAGSLSTSKILVHAAGHARHKQKHTANPLLIRRYRANAWHWQGVMGTARTRHTISPSTSVLRFWVRTARHAYVKAIHPPHKSGWLCIHRHEGSWSDSGDPYWGGLQMDRGFMSGYAPRNLLNRGLADHWSPLEQMWVAERAYRGGRGFFAWPSTARMCGLI
jgi:hypothetical protein